MNFGKQFYYCDGKINVYQLLVSVFEKTPLLMDGTMELFWMKNLIFKSIPNGIMAFESEPRQEGYLIQLALNNLEDFDTIIDEDNAPQAGSLAAQALWTILPEVNSKENEYQIKVLSHPEGKLTYTHGSSWGGRYMELDFTNAESYDPGATMYSSCLWYFRPCEFSDYFTIHNSDPRRDPNFVTFSNEPSERGQLMQLGTKELDNYSVKGVFRQDALWQFKPKNFQLFAHITDFHFEVPSESQISDEAYPVVIAEEIFSSSTTNPENYKVNFTTQIPETFKLNFLQSFKPFPERNITIDTSCFVGKNKLKFLNVQEPMNFEKKFGSNTQFICLTDTEYNIQQDFKFPHEEDVEKLKVKGYCSIVKELEIPFIATVKVKAIADCVNATNGQKVDYFQIEDSQVIEYLLKFEKFTGKIKNTQEKIQKNAGFGKKVNIQQQSVCNNDTAVDCEVSGRLRCTCGVDTYLDFKVIS
ncbi:uncharacterized protein LOC110845808 [Folsomia candida]|uniref:uncharacterized protein LOC110845808 n=1 Tax=Folsomia candida TaxID=158441 RepID=UPI001604E92E|nr:uncharacterized protein LOC110845808 [Folsomia candida]